VRGDAHSGVVLRARVETGFVGLDDRDQAVTVGVAHALEPVDEAEHWRKDFADEAEIPGGVVDALERACDHGRLDRPGEEGMVEADAGLGFEPLGVAAPLPEQHVRDVAVGLRALHEAAELLLAELRVDLEQRDRMEGAVPEPLERVMGRRRTDEVVAHPVPVGDAAAAIRGEDAARVRRDAMREIRVDYLIDPARSPCTK